MLNASDITKAIHEAFNNDPAFSKFEIERSEFVNVDPGRCPWIGIYRQTINYAPETLGSGPDYWTGTLAVDIVAQAANFNSGEDAEDDLEGYIETIINKMVEDTTIRSSVDMINEISVSYSYIAEDEETIYFQAAIISLVLEVSTS